ncbi:CoA transferase subunit A [Pseudomonas sp. 30_B]|uniref:CoA transferase subunit A n=1 Tax=Pseudomonas sp. 30_B TaxID=2813575 RepID=UPI001A9DBDB9|nr:CoA transferase subunit A [Pseudomonas sp. 30_B]
MNKQCSLEQAIAGIADGSSIMVGGFGSPGTPFSLLEELARQGKRDLTIIKNDANQDGYGVSRLIEAGAIRRMITTHLGLSDAARRAFTAGALEVEFVSQGLFAERIRCAGVGLPAFLSDIEIPEELGEARQTVSLDGRQLYVEPALRADYAFIAGHCADRAGNLRYHGSARNFGPLMAMAADRVIAEVYDLSEQALPADSIHTPGIFVHHLVAVTRSSHEYQPIPR